MPKLWPIDDEMRRWCALLSDEISGWPQVRTRPMFGMTAFYRGDRIFAAVPKTRAAETARSILVKLPGVRRERVEPASGPAAGWTSFEIGTDSDVTDALRLLERAWRKARPPSPKRSKTRRPRRAAP